jgi:hypothetical protein
MNSSTFTQFFLSLYMRVGLKVSLECIHKGVPKIEIKVDVERFFFPSFEAHDDTWEAGGTRQTSTSSTLAFKHLPAVAIELVFRHRKIRFKLPVAGK